VNAYKAYIRSEKWANKRKARKQLDQFKCVRCGCSDGRLEVYHKTYDHFMDEPLEELETLCVPCHDIETDRMHRKRYLTQWEQMEIEYEQREVKAPLIAKTKSLMPEVVGHKDERTRI